MRVIDLTLSSLALLALSPLLLIIMFILNFTGEGEIFYRQLRIGRELKPFYVLKFATMVKDSPNLGAGSLTEADDPRILPFGKILRKTKINELPQLLNVLLGDMSLIGPRPHVERDLKGVEMSILKEILTMRPGLSGIASIIFRNEEKILHEIKNARDFYDNVIAPYKAELDLWYARKVSFRLNLELIFFTILIMLGMRRNYVYLYFSDLPKVPANLKKHLIYN